MQVEDARAALLLYRLHNKTWETSLRTQKRAAKHGQPKAKHSGDSAAVGGVAAPEEEDGDDSD